MSQRTRLVLAVLVIVGGLFFMLRSMRPGPAGVSEEPGAVVSSPKSPSSRVESPEAILSRPSAPAVQPPGATREGVISALQQTYDYLIGQKKSDAERAAFREEAKIEVNLPPNLHYSRLDLEDNMAVLAGTDPKNNAAVTMIAHPGDASPSDAFNYFVEASGYLPSTKGQKILSMGQPQSLEPIQGSGVKSTTLWSGKTDKGLDVHVAVIQRADNQGTYMIVFSGPHTYFDNNEGYFEQMYQTLKADPVTGR